MGTYLQTEGKCRADDDCDKLPFRRGDGPAPKVWKTRGDFTTVLKPGKPRQLGACQATDDCDRPAVARDMCGKHYQRWAKFGDPTVTKLDRDRTVEDRFREKVDKDGPILLPAVPNWDLAGYGLPAPWRDTDPSTSTGKSIGAHRVAYRWFVGEVPYGREIDHLCRVRRCCNPAHLEAVSHQVNVLRGMSPAALNATKTHCPQNHEYTEENTYLYDGERHCKRCMRLANW